MFPFTPIKEATSLWEGFNQSNQINHPFLCLFSGLKWSKTCSNHKSNDEIAVF